MLTCYRTQRRVRAIRSGFDDRLLVFVDIEPPRGSLGRARATRQLHAWRATYDDELEILPFVRDIEIAPANATEAAVIGCLHAPADRLEIEQDALVAKTVYAIEFGETHACGLVLRLPYDASATEADPRHPLLSQLATAIDRRRITWATRRFASLRGAL